MTGSSLLGMPHMVRTYTVDIDISYISINHRYNTEFKHLFNGQITQLKCGWRETYSQILCLNMILIWSQHSNCSKERGSSFSLGDFFPTLHELSKGKFITPYLEDDQPWRPFHYSCKKRLAHSKHLFINLPVRAWSAMDVWLFFR